MTMMDTAVQQVLTFDQHRPWTAAEVQQWCEVIVDMRSRSMEPDQVPTVEALVRAVEARVNVFQADSVGLVDPVDHVDWLAERRPQIAWNFWERYRTYLKQQTQPPAVIQRLDQITDSILGKLEDPGREGSWDRRGLVVGQVQSGKTSNYTALVCKAADAGYKLIIVLAGVHNSLRSQTQLRLDEGFLGFDTQYQQRTDTDGTDHHIGVGNLPTGLRLRAASLTTSHEKGDFRDPVARHMSLPIGNYPVLLVVKKHTGILENIRTWITSVEGDATRDHKFVADVPLLIIDDEADNASIDTSKDTPDTDPTGTNKAIRKMLRAFDRSAYVGYTATPYANIYAATDTDDELGADVFPRSFIESLRAPSNYLGAERVFGLGVEDSTPLPIHRPVEDADGWMPRKHDKSWPVSEPLPESLIESMQAFLLVCAARRARGDTHVHNSMLVHVTRLQDVQHRVVEQLQQELADLQERIRYGDGDRPDQLIDELHQLWEQDFVSTSTQMQPDTNPRTTWKEVLAQLPAAVGKIEIREMNGKAKDALEYYEKRGKGLSVIAVGGDKLSRGLTLEGLSVSYYLRTTRMYDTLMQMGRWFGYRPGYEDLCRLYTTPELRRWYREITVAEAELRMELEEMAAQHEKPETYGLRVRTSSAGLTITAANKMRRAQKFRLSFSGGNPESTVFLVDPDALTTNLAALDELISGLQTTAPVGEAGNHHRWRAVPPEALIAFLERYRGDSNAIKSRSDLIARYLRDTTRVFPAWDVVLISNGQAKEPHRWDTPAGRIGMTTRALHSDINKDADGAQRQQDVRIQAEGRYTIRRVLSPPHELLNLDSDQKSAAMAATVEAWRKDPGTREEPPSLAGGPQIRRQRRPDQGLLVLYVLDNARHEAAVTRPMIGFFLSFPHASGEEGTREYAVNTVFGEQLAFLGDVGDEPDDDV